MRVKDLIEVNCGICGTPMCVNEYQILSGKGKFCGSECFHRYRIGMRPWNKGMKFPERSGSNSPNWRGGYSKDNDRRKSYESKQWRSDVFERDNWTCQTCGVRGSSLQAHHIMSWAEYPELRNDLENGVTLCVGCHKLTDSYGKPKRADAYESMYE